MLRPRRGSGEQQDRLGDLDLLRVLVAVERGDERRQQRADVGVGREPAQRTRAASTRSDGIVELLDTSTGRAASSWRSASACAANALWRSSVSSSWSAGATSVRPAWPSAIVARAFSSGDAFGIGAHLVEHFERARLGEVGELLGGAEAELATSR